MSTKLTNANQNLKMQKLDNVYSGGQVPDW